MDHLAALFNSRKVTAKTLGFTAELLVKFGRDYFDKSEVVLMDLIKQKSVTAHVLTRMMQGDFSGKSNQLFFELRMELPRTRHITRWFDGTTAGASFLRDRRG